MHKNRRTGFIGGGNMAEAIIKGLLAGGVPAVDLAVSEPSEQRRALLADRYGIGVLDDNAALDRFSETLEKVCVDTVESGFMTKDLALLVGDHQGWLTTEGFLDKIAETLEKALAA